MATGAAMLAESAGGNQDVAALAGAALESPCTVGTSGLCGVLLQAVSENAARDSTVRMKGVRIMFLSQPAGGPRLVALPCQVCAKANMAPLRQTASSCLKT